jgi:hypothetical protein
MVVDASNLDTSSTIDSRTFSAHAPKVSYKGIVTAGLLKYCKDLREHSRRGVTTLKASGHLTMRNHGRAKWLFNVSGWDWVRSTRSVKQCLQSVAVGLHPTTVWYDSPPCTNRSHHRSLVNVLRTCF